MAKKPATDHHGMRTTTSRSGFSSARIEIPTKKTSTEEKKRALSDRKALR